MLSYIANRYAEEYNVRGLLPYTKLRVSSVG